MWLYLAVVAFPLMIGSLYNESIKNKKQYIDGEYQDSNSLKFLVFISAIPMFVLIALRHESMGADTGTYHLHFLKTVNTPWDKLSEITEMEDGFAYFVKLITLITEDPLVYQCICTAIYFLCLVSFVNQLETDRFLVLFLFGTLSMYTFMFTAIRQCLAISLCLYSYKYIKKRKFIPFIILILIATQLHRSSIIFTAAFFIYPIEISARSILSFIGATLVAVIFMNGIQGWFAEQLDYEGYVVEGNAGGAIFAFAVVAMMVFATIFALQSEKNKFHFYGLANIGMISAILWVVRIFNRVAERPSFYFLTFVFAAVAYAVESLDDEKEKIISKYVVIGLALGLFYYRLNSSGSLIPYRMFEY